MASGISTECNSLLKKCQYLALCLIDALEDENYSCLEILLKTHQANPNVIVESKDYAPVHLVCGLENKDFAYRAAQLIFEEFNGDPNLRGFDIRVTPMHIAACKGYTEIFELMLKRGGDIEVEDVDGVTPLIYAVQEKQYDVVMVANIFLLEQKKERKRREIEEKRFLSPHVHNRITKTPQGVPTNTDPSSPYYIYITHRRKMPNDSKLFSPRSDATKQENENKENTFLTPVTPKKVNLFELTQSNLEEYSKLFTRNSNKQSLIESWREKVIYSSSRGSLTRNIKEMERIITGFDETTDASLNSSAFFTANPNNTSVDDSKLIRRSPRNSAESGMQLMEAYKHQDEENHIQFYEFKFHPIQGTLPKSRNADENVNTSLSTILQIPTEYETDVLRADLTAFGDPPGPITKTTKKLYLKKLMEYKQQPQLAESAQMKKTKLPNFSVELLNSLTMKEFNIHLTQYLKWEQEMAQHFRESTKKWREGNLKKSFIYFLIDPRISRNLPAMISSMAIEEVWLRFLQSIFYVGKGKSSRPYAHLYDAIKQFEVFYLKQSEQRDGVLNKKFNRIMDIWDCEKGVVCLHVFHNIIPVEAYTREAAIIDCLGLQHLTNLKRGEYYGITTGWSMRKKKQMAIGLLFKALQVYLAEGESQLSPRDLL
ncbi:ankyrin repeat and LEM domain-containing protein 1 [Lutzomyia longipalpis]|uniref:ankyrin repeat and LEM domain-containing protein 1 n=1 Tax=Lutzomyia longipalpis TaxID=7200 RepID=UPI0024843F39|nr:ankyrin repeat and LEM domain-containing protein 1 [Lutzomyia longipalpis]